MIIGTYINEILLAQQEDSDDPVEFGILINGFIYQVTATYTTFITLTDGDTSTLNEVSAVKELGRLTYLPLYHRISESSEEFYGFSNIAERELFLKVTKVSGVGAKTALNILDKFNEEQLRKVCIDKDLDALKKCKGIGTASARKIIASLIKQLGV